MKPIDPQLQSAVWSRVMAGCHEGAPMPAAASAAKEHCASSPRAAEQVAGIQADFPVADLLDMMQGEINDCAVYRYLSCKACGRDAKTLMNMADEKACHFQKLHTMYFLLTGKCISLKPVQPNCVSCLTDELRIRYQEELKAAAWYEAAAKRWPAMADEFCCMAAEETRQTKYLRSMICHRL